MDPADTELPPFIPRCPHPLLAGRAWGVWTPRDLCATRPTWAVVAGQGNVAKLQEVLELTVWFPVGETPGSLEGRAGQTKWALLPSPAESQLIFLRPPHPPALPHTQRFGKSCHRVEWKG